MPKLSKDVEAHAVAASAYLLHAYEIALDLEIDGVDEEVVCDQLDAAGGHVASAIRALHPEWRHLDDREFGDTALELFRSLKPDVDMTLEGPDGTVELIHHAIARAREGARCASRSPSRRFREISLELHFVSEHLDCALFVLDPVPYFAAIDESPASAQDALVTRLNRIELEVADHRAAVRDRYTTLTP
ncbi:MAG: hypothetical protein WD826_11110 [Actinomycetota bacterium]